MTIGIGIGIISSTLRVSGTRLVSPPLLSIPSLAVGQTITVIGGSWLDAVALQKRILADGVVIAAAATYVAQSGDEKKVFSGQERARDARGKWSPWQSTSNTIVIPEAPPYLTDAQWTGGEAAVPGDAATPRRTKIATTIAPPGDDVWRGYRGAAIPSFDPTAANTAQLTGAGPYSWISSGQNPLGAPGAGSVVYVRMARSEANDTLIVWASDYKSYIASTPPYDWTDGDNGGIFQALTGTVATGDIILSITRLPTDGGQPITALEYDINSSGTWLPLPGSALVIGTYTINFTEADTLNPVAKDFRFRVANANGYSQPSNPFNATPKASAPPAAGPAPILTSLAYSSGTNKITQTSDQAGDYYWIIESVNTVRTGAYIKAALGGAGSGTMTCAVGVVSAVPDISSLTTGNWYFKSTMQNAELTYATPETPLLLDIQAVVADPVLVQSSALNSPDNAYDTSKTFTLPGGITDGNRLFLFVVMSRVSGVGTMTLPGGWSEVGRATDVSGNGLTIILTKIAASSSGSTVVIANSGNCHMALTFYETTLPFDSYGVTWNAAGVDPPSHTPAGGSRKYLWICGKTRTRGDALISAAPTNYTGLLKASALLPGGNVAAERIIGTASRLLVASSEDPGIFTAGSPGGTAQMSFTFAAW